jgi:uncharacterized membrane-anchored protein
MQVAGRDIEGTTVLAILAGLVGLIGTAFFGWELGDGLDNPIAFAIGVTVAAVAVWISYTRR